MMLKVTVATTKTNGEKEGDFIFCREGELVIEHLICTDQFQAVECGCINSVTGIETRKSTTTFQVVEVGMDFAFLAKEIYQSQTTAGYKPTLKSAGDALNWNVGVAKKHSVGEILEIFDGTVKVRNKKCACGVCDGCLQLKGSLSGDFEEQPCSCEPCEHCEGVEMSDECSPEQHNAIDRHEKDDGNLLYGTYQCGSCEKFFMKLSVGGCPHCGSGNWVEEAIDEDYDYQFEALYVVGGDGDIKTEPMNTRTAVIESLKK